MIKVLPYNLPDAKLIDIDAVNSAWHFWVPEKLYLILGQSNKVEKSLYIDRVLEDNISVIKRPSGGESVILSPNTLIISVRLVADKLENPQISFKKINNSIISALENLGIKNLLYKGISDICIGEKKILGSSIYRKKNLVFYHAVLNLSENISLISRYLQHPPREPDYRKGRSHHEFVTNLVEQGYDPDQNSIISSLDKSFQKDLS